MFVPCPLIKITPQEAPAIKAACVLRNTKGEPMDGGVEVAEFTTDVVKKQ